ncbi:unannotated protein [freshwater metagenome]|uniref:Unannotated protein n=1 Tax=freshwater metagenome TaxID=449393 RepID=A0A6J7A1U4_9ZZZZ|nr:dephospho-CoA kinase [Actinomycetota bacterium]MSX51386.1 dephospho-CoA kinase [Actinomycetota bacterium]
MLVVALTGGIGSGKSLAAQYFSQLGALVMDADQLARTAIERGSTGFDHVVRAFGDRILHNGDIDRRELAEIIFNDPSQREVLEGIIHPIVRANFESAVELLHGDDVLIYEIPLLVETDASARFDFVITVETDDAQRNARLKERGMSTSQISQRISAQTTRIERQAVADAVIVNNGTSDDLLRQVEHLWESVLPAHQREKD